MVVDPVLDVGDEEGVALGLAAEALHIVLQPAKELV